MDQLASQALKNVDSEEDIEKQIEEALACPCVGTFIHKIQHEEEERQTPPSPSPPSSFLPSTPSPQLHYTTLNQTNTAHEQLIYGKDHADPHFHTHFDVIFVASMKKKAWTASTILNGFKNA